MGNDHSSLPEYLQRAHSIKSIQGDLPVASLETQIRSVALRREREDSWAELEQIITDVERLGPRRVSPEQLARLPGLYRMALSSLHVASAMASDRRLVAYLQSLVARAYLCVYSTRRPLWEAVLEFALLTLPAEAWRQRRHIAVSAALLLLGAASSAAMVYQDPELFYAFVAESYAQGRGPASSTEELRAVLFDGASLSASRLAHFASFLMTHNAKIGLLCFACGGLFGLPVLYLLWTNGAVLGAFTGLYASRGLTLELMSWILPHGVTELLALILCGGAGLYMGESMIFPGERGRLKGLAARARSAGVVALGAVGLFFLAGLIEGIFRQLVQSIPARFALAATTALLWTLYFGVLGRQRATQALQPHDAPSRGHLVSDEPLPIPIASIMHRALAWAVDTFIIAVIVLIGAGVLYALSAWEGEEWFGALALLGWFLVRNFYFIAFEARWQGRTPGKRLVGARVMDAAGGPLDVRAVFVRNATRDLELFIPAIAVFMPEQFWPAAPREAQIFCGLWAVLLVCLPLMNRDRLRLGDLLAGTVVLLEPARVALPKEDAVRAQRATQAQFLFSDAQLDMYGLYELQVLQEFLERTHDLDDVRAVCVKITRKIGWTDSSWERSPRTFLEDFYIALRRRREQRNLFGDRQESKKEGSLEA
jgi:uncharacterized membrane protein SpoIIM required for sporulation